jgi:hypothetical protein
MKYSFLLISVLSSCVAYTQVDVINESLMDSSLNIFYIGVDNDIKIKVKSNIAEYTIAVKGSGSSISQVSSGHYSVTVRTLDSCKLVIYKKGKEVLVRKYKVDSTPDPIATITGLRDTTMKLNRLLLNPFLMPVLPGCYLRNWFSITSFRAMVTRGNDSIEIMNAGNVFMESLVQQVKPLTHGDTIFFEDIRGVSRDDRTRKLSPFWIKIE